MQRPHSFGLVLSEVGVLSWSKLKEIADNILADGRKRLNDISVTNNGTCRQEKAPVLDKHFHLNKGSSVSAGLSQLMALAKKFSIPATYSTSIPTSLFFIIKARIFVSQQALSLLMENFLYQASAVVLSLPT